MIYHEGRTVTLSNIGTAPRYTENITDRVTAITTESHAADPIKDINDINKIISYLIKNKRWRDNMLFITGINFGLRVSDLVSLRFSDIIDDNMRFKSHISLIEKKTKNTRKIKKIRTIAINESVIKAVTLYLENTPGVSLDDYMFRSESVRNLYTNEPLSRMSVDRILKDIKKELCLDIHMSTHTLRKTFGYHQMLNANNDPRQLLLLQKIFGHSTAEQTLTYIGITNDEITDAYMNLNLGNVIGNIIDG